MNSMDDQDISKLAQILSEAKLLKCILCERRNRSVAKNSITPSKTAICITRSTGTACMGGTILEIRSALKFEP